MSFINLFVNSPFALIVAIPMLIGAAFTIVYLAIDVKRSDKSFWRYVSDLDVSYPIKPNSRLLYHKLANVAVAHDNAHEKLGRVVAELEQIKDKLQNLKEEGSPGIVEVHDDVQELIDEIQPSSNSNVIAYRSRP